MARKSPQRKPPKIAEVPLGSGERRTVCWNCSKVIGPKSLWCKDCNPSGKKMQGGKYQLRVSDRAEVERLWAQGLTIKAIAKAIHLETKYPESAFTHARASGWNLPYRQPQNVERARELGKRVLKERAGARAK